MTISQAVPAAIVAAAIGLSTAADARAAATVTIVNFDGPNEGFNDPTPVAPVGGNTGTTRGQQRLIAFQAAADQWGATIDSPVQILIQANFDLLPCTATSAVLGAARANVIFANFGQVGLAPGPVGANLWHASALADKRAGFDVNPGVADILALFNSNLGNPACLGGTTFYLGLDNNHGTNIDLVTVAVHEFAHGLGFSQFASVTSGIQPFGLSDVYNVHIFDNSTLKYWNQMTDLERAVSAINPRNVVFDGPAVDAAVPGVLAPGTPLLSIASPAAIAGLYQVGAAAFGPPLLSPGVTGQIVRATDAANVTGPSTTDACTALTNPAGSLAGKIALVDRGTCLFNVKVKNAQDAGASAVLVADNVPGGPPAGLGGVDPTITIPSARIMLADGNKIKAQLGAGVTGTLGVDLAVLSGADAHGFALLYTPNPVVPGSTISHWDTSAFPNQLMEPAINADLTHSVQPPQDLTLPVLRDVGWFPDTDVDGLADNLDACPSSNLGATIVVGGENTSVANVLFTNGCTITDFILIEAAAAKNHGQFVIGVTQLLKALEDAGVITKDERKRIHDAAAHANLP